MCHGLPEGYGGGVSITKIGFLLSILNLYRPSFAQRSCVPGSVWWSHLFSCILGVNRGPSAFVWLDMLPEGDRGDRRGSVLSSGLDDGSKPFELDREATPEPDVGDGECRFIYLLVHVPAVDMLIEWRFISQNIE
jgi:hypothetical protein